MAFSSFGSLVNVGKAIQTQQKYEAGIKAGAEEVIRIIKEQPSIVPAIIGTATAQPVTSPIPASTSVVAAPSVVSSSVPLAAGFGGNIPAIGIILLLGLGLRTLVQKKR